MSGSVYTVGLCALTPKDTRMIQIILSRGLSARYTFRPVAISLAENCDIALVDPAIAESRALFAQLKARNPRLVKALLADVCDSGGGYCILRKSLWSQLVATLEDAVQVELRSLSQPALSPAAVPLVKPPPRTATEPSPFKPGSAPPLLSQLGPLRSLILDDSVTVRNQLEAALSKVGVMADCASNADSAFHLLEKYSYDLVFLDVVMPGVDGYEVCRTLRRNAATKQLPIVMLTSRSSPFDRARGALAGCDLYLIKPIDLKTFYQAVNRIVMKLFKNDTTAAKARGYVLAS
ncbi:MAG: response regulator [Rhodanobacteraceae bacterium]|nr:response regulator [Rhodanobacteraceae bacterium]